MAAEAFSGLQYLSIQLSGHTERHKQQTNTAARLKGERIAVIVNNRHNPGHVAVKEHFHTPDIGLSALRLISRQ